MYKRTSAEMGADLGAHNTPDQTLHDGEFNTSVMTPSAQPGGTDAAIDSGSETGVVIENAMGSAAADTLIGNGADNVF